MKGILALKGLMIENRVFLNYYYYYFKLWGGEANKRAKKSTQMEVF